MKKNSTKQIVIIALVLVALVALIVVLPQFTGKSGSKQSAIDKKNAQQELVFQQVFNESFTRDSVFNIAFNTAFTQAFGADSLQHFKRNRGLPTINVTGSYNVSGVRKGEFIVPKGAMLHVTGILIGRVQIDGGSLQNDGFIIGNVVNEGGAFQDNGMLQGALLVK